MESPVPVPAEPDAPDEAGGSPAATEPAWRFLVLPQWVAWHVFIVVSCWIMLWAGDWQLHRALAGNSLSWAYTFEWPLFVGFAVVFWARTVRDEFRLRRADDPAAATADTVADPDLPEGIGSQPVAQPADDAGDAELASYNAYLARLNAEVKGHGKWRGFR